MIGLFLCMQVFGVVLKRGIGVSVLAHYVYVLMLV